MRTPDWIDTDTLDALPGNRTERLAPTPSTVECSRPPLRRAISAACRRDEAQCVDELVTEWRRTGVLFADPSAVRELAARLVTATREQRRGASGVDHLMHEFSLSSQEGVALMCLAEALLRIPDAATADRLIRDKIGRGNWRAHLGHSTSLFVNAATWGLLITGKLVATHSEQALGGALSRLLARGGEPLIRHGVDFAMRLLGQQFVMGKTIDAALARSRNSEARGYTHSFDMLGEAALSAADAERYTRAYAAAIDAIGRTNAGRGVRAGPGISLKLSALHPRYSRAQRGRVLSELLPRLKALLVQARHHDIGVNIDAEEADRLELSLDLFDALAADPDLAGWEGLGFVVQAYQKRCPAVIEHLIALARRSGRRLMVRLVKGAYWDSEIKRAQVDGQEDYPVYTRKAHSDLSYLVCAGRLLAAPDAIYPQFATHNAHTLASVYRMATARGVDDYEFQCLHGMGETLYDQVVGTAQLDRPCRIYAPVGNHETLLPYLVRRLLENGAGNAFVNRLVDTTVSIDELLADPLDAIYREGGTRHPAIPLPRELYGERRNSAGIDLTGEIALAAFEAELAVLHSHRWQALPLLAGQPHGHAGTQPIRNPAMRDEIVGNVREASIEEVAQAIDSAAGYAEIWPRTAPARRAALLEDTADLMERRRSELCSLCLREAGKTWANAVAEVREAVDFCRYYAQQARTRTSAAAAPGPVACISPWNFPLAIFVGEVAAALAAGSPVLAKPAGQTPLIAARAVELFHQAGVPAGALQFLPGRGETVGAALTADPRVRGVVFTGSSEVARLIERSLAARPAGTPETCLIAETGGLNAMIVDASALPEQVVQDVLVSAFDSAGQRCSALRVLCLQEEIAGRVLGMLRDAMRELELGNPAHLSTDIGPVIDEAAKEMIEAHIAAMRAAGKPVFRSPLPTACAAGCFVAPTLIEIDALSEAGREVFGPVLHVLRFRGSELDALTDAINATGHGLTFGLHTRIDETVERVAARIRAGNVYVNRNMIGAVVGVQPFGGEGKSGTGPKAGGPLYLPRLSGCGDVPPASLGAQPPDAPPDELAAFRALSAWAQSAGDSALSSACARYAAATLLGWHIDLPGPTGERNTLHFAPRGAVFCTADHDEELLLQIAAALASGNSALLAATPAARELCARLPAAVAARLQLLSENDALTQCAAVLFAGEGADEAAVHRRCAALDGALRPLVRRHTGAASYPLQRLIVERVLSVNTTAAGGNTTLMSLGT